MKKRLSNNKYRVERVMIRGAWVASVVLVALAWYAFLVWSVS